MKKLLYLTIGLAALLLCSCHRHYFIEEIERVENCTAEGYSLRACECGETEKTELSAGHDWDYNGKSCTVPLTCKRCGETDGDPFSHSISSDGKCGLCEKEIIKVSTPLPTTVSYNYYGGTYTKFEAKNVSYFYTSYGTNMNNGKLQVFVSGTKTFDWKGNYGTTMVQVLVILKDSNGKIIGSDKITSVLDDVVVGQAFSGSVTFDNISTNKEYTVELKSVV